MTLPRLSFLLALASAALALVGVLVGAASVVSVEGAYFTRAGGGPAVSNIFSASGSGLSLLSPNDGNLWLGAGIALLLAAAGALFAQRAGMQLTRAHD